MDFRPINRATRHHGSREPRAVAIANARRRALCLAGLCIAAFETSQLVFNSATCPSWADASEQIARADVASAHGSGSGEPALIRADQVEST